MKIDERALTAAIAAAADCRWMFTRQEGRADMAAIIRAYLDAMPKPAPEEKRDRIAVVVDADGMALGESAWPSPNWGALEAMAADLGASGPFARAIVHCNLPRPAAPVEVDGSVEVVP